MPPSVINNAINAFGLKELDVQNIMAVIQQHKEVEEAVIFGSRAKGNYTTGSDIDIALKGAAMNHAIVRNVSYLLNEETQMPYRFDIVNYHTIVNADMLDHINRAGISFYKRV